MVGSIDHPVEPHAIFLRMSVGGGFVPVEWALVEGPTFILYGSNVVIYRPAADESAVGIEAAWRPYRCALLAPEQVDDLLGYALEEAGLAEALEVYPQSVVADAPNTHFEISAGGVTRAVVVEALGLAEGASHADARARLGRLADRLADFQGQVDAGGVISSGIHEPALYRAIPTPGWEGDGTEALAWPWDDLSMDDFVTSAQGLAAFAVLAPAQAALVTEVPTGGAVSIPLRDPDGLLHYLSVRPILPGEPELPA